MYWFFVAENINNGFKTMFIEDEKAKRECDVIQNNINTFLSEGEQKSLVEMYGDSDHDFSKKGIRAFKVNKDLSERMNKSGKILLNIIYQNGKGFTNFVGEYDFEVTYEPDGILFYMYLQTNHPYYQKWRGCDEDEQ